MQVLPHDCPRLWRVGPCRIDLIEESLAVRPSTAPPVNGDGVDAEGVEPRDEEAPLEDRSIRAVQQQHARRRLTRQALPQSTSDAIHERGWRVRRLRLEHGLLTHAADEARGETVGATGRRPRGALPEGRRDVRIALHTIAHHPHSPSGHLRERELGLALLQVVTRLREEVWERREYTHIRCGHRRRLCDPHGQECHGFHVPQAFAPRWVPKSHGTFPQPSTPVLATLDVLFS